MRERRERQGGRKEREERELRRNSPHRHITKTDFHPPIPSSLNVSRNSLSNITR